jgi:hypothetical protein
MAAEGLPSPAEFAALRAAAPGRYSAEDCAVLDCLVRAWAVSDADALGAAAEEFTATYGCRVQASLGWLLLVEHLGDFGVPTSLADDLFGRLVPAGYPVKVLFNGHRQEISYLVQLPKARPPRA